MEKESKVSAKSTKNEILDAYNELLEKVQGQMPADRKADAKREEEKEIVKDVSQNTIEKIVKGLADIKLETGKAFNYLEDQLVTQFKRLTETQHAIDIETKRLKDIHEINVNADSLAALLLAQKEKRASFEAEMEQKRRDFDAEMAQKKQEWKKEQDAFDLARKEREEKIKKERQREEEEYTYSIQLKRKKETDAYEAKKAAQEKDLAEKKAALEKELIEKKAAAEKSLSEREAAVAAKEKEFEELKAKAAQFPKDLEKAVKDAEKAATEKLGVTFKHQAELAEKEIEGERRLYKQTIAALESKIKEQEAQILGLTQRAQNAGQQVQEIAVKAIEGASAQRLLSMNYEKRAAEAPKS